MNVIGNKWNQETRLVKWNDLLESRRCIKAFSRSANEQEQRMAEIDRDFYYRSLSRYVA